MQACVDAHQSAMTHMKKRRMVPCFALRIKAGHHSYLRPHHATQSPPATPYPHALQVHADQAGTSETHSDTTLRTLLCDTRPALRANAFIIQSYKRILTPRTQKALGLFHPFGDLIFHLPFPHPAHNQPAQWNQEEQPHDLRCLRAHTTRHKQDRHRDPQHALDLAKGFPIPPPRIPQLLDEQLEFFL